MALTALTVRTDELPTVMDVGFAVMLTVGGAVAVTVSVALAEVVPPRPVAPAVYVVVEVGWTDWVPPLGGRVYVVPSLPDNAT